MPDEEPKVINVASLAAASFGAVFSRATLTVHSPLPEAHPFYVKVGLIASEWAHLEHILDLIIWEICKIDHATLACLTAQIMGVGPRCKAIIALCGRVGISDEIILKKIRKLMSDSYGPADERARVVHDPWYIRSDDNQVGQFKAMPYSDQRFGIQEVMDNEIATALEHIRSLKVRANEIRGVISVALQPTSP